MARTRNVAISGATGLVGTALSAFLSAGGQRVRRIVRRAAGEGDILWDPVAGTIDSERLAGLDAVVHLAGENIAAGRWSSQRKRRIAQSRVEGTRLVAQAIAGMERPPQVLVVASAVGYYGDRGDELLEESSKPGSGFLAETCEAWEAASHAAELAGIRVVRLRIGVVLAARGGALRRMLPLFRLGLGGRLGDGRQYMSWIALDDLIGVIHRALHDETLSGAVNAVAPTPVTNTEFTRTLGRVLRRPTPFPVPGPLLRAALGELGDALLLGGARVFPRRLERSGFPFRHPTLEAALRFELGREQDRSR